MPETHSLRSNAFKSLICLDLTNAYKSILYQLFSFTCNIFHISSCLHSLVVKILKQLLCMLHRYTDALWSPILVRSHEMSLNQWCGKFIQKPIPLSMY